MCRWKALAVAAVALVAQACGGAGSPPGSASSRVEVVAGFYPLEYVAARVAGERGSVHSLAKPGAEPHDLELTAKETSRLRDANVVVYLRGFQPDVDAAVDTGDKARAFDVAPVAKLEAHDPHFWLDPLRLADVADAIADRLGGIDTAGASTYRTNAAAVRDDLEALDREFTQGLKNCRERRLVTSHDAFGYLARRYDLKQRGIAGIDPESEPSSAEQARIAELIKAEGVKTVFTEPLVDSSIADTVAKEAGVRSAVLDPVEGIDDSSKGKDYPSVMRANLAALREGLACR